MTIRKDGKVGIGTTSPGALLELDQAATDVPIMKFVSSDVAHGMTDIVETDVYASFVKTQAASGGLMIRGWKDADGVAGAALALNGNLGEAADTTKSTSAEGIVEINSAIKTSANITAAGSNENLMVIQNNATTRFIFDAEGDSHQDVGTAWTNFDNEQDAMVTRSLGIFMSPETAIKSKWDDWGRDHKEDLIRCGIMPELTEEEEKNGDHALVNTTQVMRLHNGAIWQQHEKYNDLLNAFMELAKKTIGEEEAKNLLKKNDIDLIGNC